MNNKHCFSILAVASAVLLIASCQKPAESKSTILFDANVAAFQGAATKAAPIDDLAAFEDTYSTFSVSAYSGTTQKINNAQVYNDETLGWTLNSSTQWLDGEVMEFYGVAPESGASLTIAPASKSATFSYTTSSTTPDLLLGYYSGTGVVKNDKKVAQLDFDHPLAAVRFKVGDIIGATVKNITLTKVYSSGDCSTSFASFGTADSPFSWTTTGTAADLSNDYNFAATTTGQLINNEPIMLIPQKLGSDAKIKVQLTVEKGGADVTYNLSASLKDVQFKAGTITNIIINYAGVYLESFDVAILPWVEGTPYALDPDLIVKTAYLTQGTDFNGKMIALAGGNVDNITQIIFDKYAPVETTGTEIQNVNKSDVPIYATYDSGVIKITTNAQWVLTDVNCQGMFKDFSSMTVLSVADFFQTTNTTNMSEMFMGCSSVQVLNLADVMTTSNVKNMSHMFDGCSAMTQIDLGVNFNTANVTNMSYMFNNCESVAHFTLGDYFDTAKVTDMDHMFYNCHSMYDLDMGNLFNTSKVKNMNSMYAQCRLNGLHFNSLFRFDAITDANDMMLNANGGDKDVWATDYTRNWLIDHRNTVKLDNVDWQPL